VAVSGLAARPDRIAPLAGTRPLARGRAGEALLVLAGAGLIVALAVLGDTAHGAGDNTLGQAIACAAGGGALTAAALARRAGAPAGALAGAAFALFVGLAGLSTAWSVEPSDTWLATNGALANLGIFAAGLGLAWIAPRRWETVLAAVGLACAGLAAYGLASKSFPVRLHAETEPARLSDPIGYWNAFGLVAALGLVPALWAGARRTGPAAVRVAAPAALGVLMTALMLSLSRGALIAGAIGVLSWLAIAPRRLRSVGLLAGAAASAGAVSLWAFSRDSLTTDQGVLGSVPTPHQIGQRVYDGHRLALLLAAMVVVLLAFGLLLERAGPVLGEGARRRRVERATVTLLGLLALGGLVAVLASHGGPSGTYHDITARLGGSGSAPAVNSPRRLASVSSARSKYWTESRRLLADAPLSGKGYGAFGTARKLERRDSRLGVGHAHGQLFEAAAGLGVPGLALGVAFILAWLLAARRTLGLTAAERRSAFTPERIGLTALAAVAVTFGAHSLIDWTWSIPATATIGLLCAGFVAGRGAFGTPQADRSWRPSAARVLAAGVAVVAALGALWSSWSPWRSQVHDDRALAALSHDDIARALSETRRARDANPLALEPLFTRSVVQQAAGDDAAAMATLREATRLQPDNPRPWLEIGLAQTDARKARIYFLRAHRLDPKNGELNGRIGFLNSHLGPPSGAGRSPDSL
jgi:tetratricopeptide (TPR) repeat protein